MKLKILIQVELGYPDSIRSLILIWFLVVPIRALYKASYSSWSQCMWNTQKNKSR